MGILPRRSREFGVGKEIGGAVYVHRQYELFLPTGVSAAKLKLSKEFDYTVVKYTSKSKTYSFISSPDFDASDEPVVGELVSVAADGTITHRKQLTDPYIYHHKWLFVADDYKGFDVEESKRRSLTWLALENVDKSRIGRRSYWEEYVLPRLSEYQWLRSREACKRLGVSPCELSHLRLAGTIEFKKQGNAFLYFFQDPSG